MGNAIICNQLRTTSTTHYLSHHLGPTSEANPPATPPHREKEEVTWVMTKLIRRLEGEGMALAEAGGAAKLIMGGWEGKTGDAYC